MKKVHTMKSMELDDEDKLDFAGPMPMPNPDFPCGLRICLTSKEFDKLGLDPTQAKVGEIFHLHGMARVMYISHSQDGARVEAQIEDLDIESEDDENEGDE